MSESVESLGRPPLEVVELPTESLSPDELNPNRVDEPLMEALRRDIADHGFVQPVVVRPLKGDRYRIVDGEHRWRVLRDLGAGTVPCVVDDAPEDDARMRMLTMNRLRGTFAPVKLAQVLAGLASQLNEEELRERLGMDEEEFDAALELKDAGEDVDEALRKLLDREDRDAPELLRFHLGPRQAKTFERTIDLITAAGKTRAEALIELLEEED